MRIDPASPVPVPAPEPALTSEGGEAPSAAAQAAPGGAAPASGAPGAERAALPGGAAARPADALAAAADDAAPAGTGRAARRSGRGDVLAKLAARQREPALPDDMGPITYVRARGTLYVNGIEADDVVQGSFGNCFLLASLAAVAHTDPERIADMIERLGPDTYRVTFKLRTRDGVEDIPIVVRATLPWDEGGAVGAEPRADKGNRLELWVAVIEKAFAELLGGYDALDEGGFGAEALRYITGRPVTHRHVANADPDALWGRITRAVESGYPVVTSTWVDDTEEEELEDTGIVMGHVYTLLGAGERDGVRYVRLRNPWGRGEPEGNGRDDGIFELSFDEYLEVFEDIDFCNA